ncbi:MAG: hypothetical protein HY678_03680, partial [Chloroflexi bacterium]|nr:hypothetical protein [Chloroflexota bacterium]
MRELRARAVAPSDAVMRRRYWARVLQALGKSKENMMSTRCNLKQILNGPIRTISVWIFFVLLPATLYSQTMYRGVYRGTFDKHEIEVGMHDSNCSQQFTKWSSTASRGEFDLNIGTSGCHRASFTGKLIVNYPQTPPSLIQALDYSVSWASSFSPTVEIVGEWKVTIPDPKMGFLQFATVRGEGKDKCTSTTETKGPNLAAGTYSVSLKATCT